MKKLIFVLLFLPQLLFATNYYVKNGGDDEAVGTSDGTAWATIAKVNATSFDPGDTIFFNRGDTWLLLGSTLSVPSSGTHDHPIVFTAYGTGSKPVISLAIQYDTWANYSGNIYYSTGAYQCAYLCLFDGTTWGKTSTKANLDTEGEWAQTVSAPAGGSNDTIFVYTTSPEDLPNVVFGSYNTAFEINGKDYITVSYLQIRYSGAYGFVIDQSTGSKIDSCKTDYCPLGITVDEADTIIISNNIITNCGGDGMYFSGYSNNVYIFDNNFSVCGVADIGSDNQSIGMWFVDDIYCYNNYINHTGTGSVIEASASIASHYWQDNVNFYNNYITTNVTNNSVFSIFSGEYNIHNNIVIMTGESNSAYFIGMTDTGNPTTANIYNNTIIGAGRGVDFWIPFGTESNSSDIKVKNNIFYGILQYYLHIGTVFLDNFESDYNLFLSNTGNKFATRTGGDDAAYNFDGWKTATSEDANSAIGDPLFTTEFTDLTLQAGSPAIGAGIGVGLLTDYSGYLINDPPDLGAYAYDSEIPAGDTPPVINTTNPGNVKATKANGGGNVTSDGGAEITQRGVVWSTSANPTTSDNKTIVSGTTGSFTAILWGLSSNTTYHVRSFATNIEGTSYGADVEFTTAKYTIPKSGTKVFIKNGKILINK